MVKVNTGYDGEQIKVLWNKATWFDPADGYSAEYVDTLEVIRCLCCMLLCPFRLAGLSAHGGGASGSTT